MCPEIFAKIAPGIVRHIETLINDGKIGVCAGTIRILDQGTSCSTLKEDPCLDRFKIAIPYCGQSVFWEVIFNYESPEEPPDFLFGAEEKDFLPEIENVKSLVDWQPYDSYALTNVINELLEEYRSYHCSLINLDSRLQFEYKSLLEEGKLRQKDIEIHVARRTAYRVVGPVNFLIKLPIDFSRIPAYLTKDNPGEDTAVLLITFQTPDGVKVTPQLFLSPRVELALGGAANLRIPSYPKGGCLIDYVPSLCELLNNKVEQIVSGYEKRREYISAFLSLFGRSVVEYDSEAFTKISLLLVWHDFFFVLTVELLPMFPTDAPVFTFQSIYHETIDGKPYTKSTTDYPYSPRWTAVEMAERAKIFILEHIRVFQRMSVKDGSI